MKITEIKNKHIVKNLEAIKPETKYSYNDKGNGELFAELYKNKCRFNVTAKEWYHYDGSVWSEDTGGMIASRYAKELADSLLIYCTNIQDEARKKAYIEHVAKLGQLRYRNTMLIDARDKYFISNDDLDKDLFLYNCQNGTMNLRDFTFLPHNPDDLLSKISNVFYDPEAQSQLFIKFMDQIMMGNTDKISYLQKLFGYSLTGDTREESCYILYGASTRNGKGTLMETISYMLGNSEGYALAMKPESLAQKQNNDSRQASGDIARLKGCRFLNVSEPPKRMLLDAGLLKTLLGRDTITARHLHEREFEFLPSFHLFMNTNYLPHIQDDTLFSSGRINVISFDRHFEEDEQDKNLKSKLQSKENISGIFNWVLDGLKRYYAEGAKSPEVVMTATTDYRAQSDKLGNFIGECLVKSPQNTKAGEVYKKYQEWCSANGYGSENKGNFFAELKAKGIFKPTGTVNRITERNVVIGYVLDDSEFVQVPEGSELPFQ